VNRRPLLLVLTAVLAIGLAIPAFGQETSVAPTFDRQGSARAIAKARLALLTARSALGQAQRAVQTSQTAKDKANTAKGIAAGAQTALDATKIQSAVATGGVTTDSSTFVPLAGGPSVTVAVPSSGLIEVWAQATMNDAGAISLFEDGQQMAGQSEECSNGDGGALFAGPPGGPGTITVGTPAPAIFCSTSGAPGSVLLQTTPGQHTYELRYEYCGCGGPDVTFTNRRLMVAPRL
jgi:hypothetical protein